mmetsp:Transcript_35715/g.33844  ORF Transcript_35715/g.33844 Transcript_35715/m.33844 type:complete len:81 (-) Transcript_35715:70-312(-)
MTEQTRRNSWKRNLLKFSVTPWRSRWFDLKKNGRILPFSATACDDIPSNSIFTDMDRYLVLTNTLDYHDRYLGIMTDISE